MKALLLLATLFLVSGSSAARADFIVPMDTPTGTGDCGVVLPPGVPVTVYVIHKFTTGATSSEWRISNPSEVGVLGMTSPFPFIGDLFTGIKFTYPACLTDAFLVCEVTVVNLGLTDCGALTIVPSPGKEDVQYTDCFGTPFVSAAGRLVYSTPSKQCTELCTVPTEPSTWGSVKALYR